VSTGTLQIDLGPTNTDRFVLTGSATLSGLLDVVLEPGFTPSGSYTVLTSSGPLNAAGLSLHPSDLSTFTLSVSGNSLVLMTGGASIPGDFNHNGVVNGADLTKWKSEFGVSAGSDADGDGDSDGNDFLIWQRNAQNAPATGVSTVVPEPMSLTLATACFVCMASVTCRGRRHSAES